MYTFMGYLYLGFKSLEACFKVCNLPTRVMKYPGEVSIAICIHKFMSPQTFKIWFSVYIDLHEIK